MSQTKPSPALTPEQRRALVEAPIRFSESGGKSHGGSYRITDAQEEVVRERYLRSLRRRESTED